MFTVCKSCGKSFGIDVEFARACSADVNGNRAARAALCTECGARKKAVAAPTKTRRDRTPYTLRVNLGDWKSADLFRGDNLNAGVTVDSRHGKAVLEFPPATNTSGLKSSLRIISEFGGWRWLEVEIPLAEELGNIIRQYDIAITKTGCYRITLEDVNKAFWRIQFLRELEMGKQKPQTILKKFLAGKADCQLERCNSREG